MPERRTAVAFVETNAFTRRVVALGLEEPLRDLQMRLLENPEAGAMDRATGELRKVRMPDPGRGKGKSGGARVHYLWLPDVAVVYMLWVYSKDDADSLTAKQKRQLHAIVEEIKREWLA